jgi:hypothetical protein
VYNLCVNQWWRMLRKRLGQNRKRPTRLGTAAAVLLTFVAWLVGLAFFRADSVPHAVAIVAGMFGHNGFALPDQWLAKWGDFGRLLAAGGIAFSDSRGLVTAGLINWIVISAVDAWFAPNTQQIMARFNPALLIPRDMVAARKLAWRPTVALGLIAAVIAFASIVNLHRQSEFLYFQF